MIAPSLRRRPGIESADEAFRLHLKLARRSGMGRRLLRGSVAALVCSAIALLLGVGLAAHAVFIGASFLAGFAAPVPGLRQRALAEIRSHVGMSYETALDLIGAGGSPVGEQVGVDPYGLKAAVIDRARRAVADVRPTATPSWWLPALAVALALLLFSGLDLTGAPGGSGANGLSAPPAGTSAVPLDERDEVADDGDVQAPQAEAPGRAEEPDDQQTAPDDEDRSVGNTPDPAEGAGDGAPLSRFLDSLRERPPEPGAGNQAPQDQAGQGTPDTQPPGQGQAGGNREGEPERVEMPADPGSQAGEDGQAASAGDGGEGQEPGEDVLVASDGDDGGDSDSQGESQGGDSNGQAPGDRQAGGEQEAEPGGEGEQGFEQGGAGDGEGSDDPASDGAAGFGGGQETPAGVADGESQRPEFLRGVLEEGPESPAGAVRLPGQTDVTLPPGSASPADYAAAAEEALSEGDLPLSYQEIIRRYFQ